MLLYSVAEKNRLQPQTEHELTKINNIKNQKYQKYRMHWRPSGELLPPDRLLLLVFFLAMTISSLVILTSSPHLKLDLDMESGSSDSSDTVES